MKVKFLTFVMFALSCFLTTLMAQTISVKGIVTDETKLPMPGVSVVVKGLILMVSMNCKRKLAMY